jgi:pescadillo protein
MVKSKNANKKRGSAARYLTRTQSLRKLQLKLNEFRRLCILKGIFPKEPPKFFKGVNKTYYLKKDINFLANEKLLNKFREIKTYQKKIKKAQKKGQKFDAKKLIENRPRYTLNHIIKERYPRFIDALQDIDDALCLIGIFANLPKFDLLKISAEKVNMSKRLLREFYLYTSINQNIKKGFISIKGIYLTCEIMGEEITWLNPFSHPQKITYDIDYEIMNDFLELYISLMQFVNFKLFKDIGLDYPPPEENFDIPFFGFNSLNIKQLQEKAQEKKIGDETGEIKDPKEKVTNEVNIESKEWNKITKITEEDKKLKNLFKNLIFFISREVPIEIFETVISSCGGLYGDSSDTSAFTEDDKRITHYIVDRPPNGINMKPNKEYVQPQWIFDCLNKKMILPVSNYAPGKKLPPHLSPYYEVNEKGEYVYEVDDEEMKDEEDKDNNKKNDNNELTKEDKELREMMLSNNKKKLLQKIRDEALKKKKTKIKVSKHTTNTSNVSAKRKNSKDNKDKNIKEKNKDE